MSSQEKPQHGVFRGPFPFNMNSINGPANHADSGVIVFSTGIGETGLVFPRQVIALENIWRELAFGDLARMHGENDLYFYIATTENVGAAFMLACAIYHEFVDRITSDPPTTSKWGPCPSCGALHRPRSG